MLNKILIMMISIFVVVFISSNLMFYGAHIIDKFHSFTGILFIIAGFIMLVGTFFSIEKIDY